ncbi:hypothetical protein [Sinomonas atrocyanea]
MTKGIITRTWIWGIIGMGIGLVVAGVATAIMLAYGGTYVNARSGNGYDFVPTPGGTFWSTVVFICVGGLIALGGIIAQFVAWVGALVNSYQLPDKMWFLLTLLLGLIGFGLVVMIVYLIAAPEGYPGNARAAAGGAGAAYPAPPEDPFPRTA